MGVNGGGLEAVVPEQQLDRSDVGAGFQQVSGEAVSKRVRSNRLSDTAVAAGTLTDALKQAGA